MNCKYGQVPNLAEITYNVQTGRDKNNRHRRISKIEIR